MLNSFVSFLQEPFKSNMSAGRWFAFVGLLIAIMALWGMALKRLSEL